MVKQTFGGQFLWVFLANARHTIPGCVLPVRARSLAFSEFAHSRARSDPLVAFNWRQFECTSRKLWSGFIAR